MSRKEEYKLQNEQFLEQLRTAEGIKELPCGILYRVLEEGRDGLTPRLNSVVSVHYKGTLINGTRTSGPIPAFSTLIFEVELLNIS